jgi:hypothetical protein
MHTYGLALDIKYAGNPFVQGARFTEALKHAALLVGGLAITQRTSEAFFASLAGTGDTASVYRAVSLYDGYFRRYLAPMPSTTWVTARRSGHGPSSATRGAAIPRR